MNNKLTARVLYYLGKDIDGNLTENRIYLCSREGSDNPKFIRMSDHDFYVTRDRDKAMIFEGEGEDESNYNHYINDNLRPLNLWEVMDRYNCHRKNKPMRQEEVFIHKQLSLPLFDNQAN